MEWCFGVLGAGGLLGLRDANHRASRLYSSRHGADGTARRAQCCILGPADSSRSAAARARECRAKKNWTSVGVIVHPGTTRAGHGRDMDDVSSHDVRQDEFKMSMEHVSSSSSLFVETRVMREVLTDLDGFGIHGAMVLGYDVSSVKNAVAPRETGRSVVGVEDKFDGRAIICSI